MLRKVNRLNQKVVEHIPWDSVGFCGKQVLAQHGSGAEGCRMAMTHLIAFALKAGATSIQEPVQKEDEDKRGGVKDAGGTTWWIATKVE